MKTETSSSRTSHASSTGDLKAAVGREAAPPVGALRARSDCETITTQLSGDALSLQAVGEATELPSLVKMEGNFSFDEEGEKLGRNTTLAELEREDSESSAHAAVDICASAAAFPVIITLYSLCFFAQGFYDFSTGEALRKEDSKLHAALLQRCPASPATSSPDFCWFDFLFRIAPAGGAVLGGITGGVIGEIWGRSISICFGDFFILVGCLLGGVVSNSYLLFCSEALCGVGFGSSVIGSVAFICESSPVPIRGICVIYGKVLELLGSLAACSSARGGSHIAAVAAAGVPALTALIQFISAAVGPESARWLLQQQRPAKALHALELLGEKSMNATAFVLHQGKNLSWAQTDTIASDASALPVGFFQKQRKFLKGIRQRQSLALLSSACIVAIVNSYPSDIFSSLSLTDYLGGDTQAMGLSVAFAQGTGVLLCCALADVWGRKPLLLWGTGGITIGYAAAAVGFLCSQRDGLPLKLPIFSALTTSGSASEVKAERISAAGKLVEFGLLISIFMKSLSWNSLFLLMVSESVPTKGRCCSLGTGFALFKTMEICMQLVLSEKLLGQKPAAAFFAYSIFSCLALAISCTLTSEKKHLTLEACAAPPATSRA